MRNTYRPLFLLAAGLLVSAAGGCAMNIGQKNIAPAAFNGNAPAGATVADADMVASTARASKTATVAVAPKIAPRTAPAMPRHAHGRVPLEPAGITADVTGAPSIIPADALTPTHHALQVDALLGTVNGRPLFVGDLLRPIARQLHHEAAACRSCRDFRRQAAESIYERLQQHISNLLMRDAAREHMSKTQRGFLNLYTKSERTKLVSQYKGSAALADRALRLRGTTLVRYLANKRRHEMVQLYLSERIAPRMEVTRRQIYEYYRHHLKQFTRRAKLSLYMITYPVARKWPARYRGKDATGTPSPAEIQQARVAALAYADHLENELRAHKASFAELAEENSVDPLRDQGGHWENFHRGMLNNKALEDMAFDTPAHSMAPPRLLLTPHDPRRDMVVIIRVGSVKPRRVAPFSEAQVAISERMNLQQSRRYYGAYYKRLEKQSTVEEAMHHIVSTAANVALADYYLCDKTNP